MSPGSRVANVGSQSVTLRTVELRQAGHTGSDQASRLMVWQIYWINGTLTSSDHIAKVYSAIYRLLGRGDDSAVIVVYADKLQTGPSDVALESFLAANYGAINALLRQSKASP